MWEYNQTSELYHYGVLGMKWGHRKNYDSMSSEKLYKHLKKDIRNERAKQNGSSNRWRQSIGIGQNSKEAIKKMHDDEQKFNNSDEYKKWLKKAKKVDKKWADVESGKITEEQWTKERDKIYSEMEGYTNKYGRVGRVEGRAVKYAKEFVEGYGKDISVAYLKDLGYDNDTSRKYVDQLLKSGLTLGRSV